MYLLLFFTAFVLSGIAAYYSVIGLIAIFSAAIIPVAIMGGSLEVAKLVVASWLYRYWKSIPMLMRGYFTAALVILMLITSMGIFGFLSKAHSDQSLVSGDVAAKISIYDEKIKTAKENIDANRKQLKQMDEAVDQVMGRSTDEKGADKAVALRRGQAKDRARLLQDIEAEQKKITSLNEERAPIAAEVRKVEAEVGPIKYIAAMIYGDNPDENMLEHSVRWLIILLICVFDPLAVLMLIAANLTQIKQKEWREEKEESLPPGWPFPTYEEITPKYEQDDGPLTDEQIEQIKETAKDDLPTGETIATSELFSEQKKDDPHAVGWMFETTTTTKEYKVIPEDTEIAEPEEPVQEENILEKHPYLTKGNFWDKPEGWGDVPPQVYIPEPVVEEIIVEEPVDEPVDEVQNPEEEQTPDDKSLDTSKNVSVGQQVEQMIENKDHEGLEEIYKNIVKELAKQNRKKSTHWGPK